MVPTADISVDLSVKFSPKAVGLVTFTLSIQSFGIDATATVDPPGTDVDMSGDAGIKFTTTYQPCTEVTITVIDDAQQLPAPPQRWEINDVIQCSGDCSHILVLTVTEDTNVDYVPTE